MKKYCKLVGIWATCILLCICLCLLTESGNAFAQAKSRFVLIDGNPVIYADLDVYVVAVVVKDETDSLGRPVLYGFTSLEKFHQYLSTHKSEQVARNKSTAYFYEHINLKGEQYRVPLGKSVKYVGDKWNDRISSVIPSCRGKWTVLYQHINYGGEAIAFENSSNSCRYYFNLTDFYLSNGQSWNDQVSSIRVY